MDTNTDTQVDTQAHTSTGTDTGTSTDSNLSLASLTAEINSQDVGAFRPYDSALPVPTLKGTRTVKLLYKKNPKTGKSMAENSFIRVADYLTEDLVVSKVNELASYVVSFLQAEEDKLIKSYHVAGAKRIEDRDLSLDAIIESLEASMVSSRLNKEKIAEWFKLTMEEQLIVIIASKLGLPHVEVASEAELEKIETIVLAYKAKFESFASGKTYYRKEEAESLLRALELTGADKSFIGSKFIGRLDKMINDKPDDLLMSL